MTKTTKQPIPNEDILLVEPSPSGIGTWQLRFQGDAQEDAIGSFPSCEAAAKAAHANCTNVRVVEPTTLPAGVQAMPSRSAEARIADLHRNPALS